MIGIIGGTGLYSISDELEPYSGKVWMGAPVSHGTIDGKSIVFLPRHGEKHTIPPHRVRYGLNMQALSSMGVTKVLAVCAVGSLHPSLQPGDLLIPDQIIDRTFRRDPTLLNGVSHLSFADPYCNNLRQRIISQAPEIQSEGTVVVIEGPRFSTKAESRVYSQVYGAHVINMTQMPEAQFARELGMCYATIAVVTDYDSGIEGYVEPVTHERVHEIFSETLDKVKVLLMDIVKNQDLDYECETCPQAPKLAYHS